MWSLKPYKSPPSKCPSCSFANSGFEQHIFTGVHILGRGTCANCGTMYLHNWPIAHGAEYPIAFTDNGIATYDEKAYQWLASPLIRAIKQDLQVEAPVKRIIRREIKQVLLLNCLDPCFGHIIWKLLNVHNHQNTSGTQGVVVLIPANCTWMVPDYVAEIWSVQISLPDLNRQLTSLKKFLKNVMGDYDSLQILPVHTHIDHHDIDFFQFFRTRSFRLSEWNSHQSCVTFIWREDRFWIRSRMEEILSFTINKYSLGWLKPWLLSRQLKAFRKVGQKVRQALPKVKIKVTGLGNWGSFPDDFEDMRVMSMTEEVEKAWNITYAQSHLVIGVHGSNMLIPTALAAGFIELLPNHKIPFMSEDILTKHPSRFQTFLGRHLGLFTSTNVVVNHVISVFRDFPYLYKNANPSHE